MSDAIVDIGPARAGSVCFQFPRDLVLLPFVLVGRAEESFCCQAATELILRMSLALYLPSPTFMPVLLVLLHVSLMWHVSCIV